MPYITVWINGINLTDWADSRNALQVHGGKGWWAEGAHHRFRNIAIKQL